jgi:glycosyltransferase involved in cell wall biosynthesis
VKILFVAPGIVTTPGQPPRFAPFQEADLTLLRELGHEVRPLLWHGRPILQVLRGARWADLVFAWNISDHAFFASFAARRLACVVGGYEFANLPECRYGNLISRRMRFITRWVWKRADALLYVDPSLEEEATRAFGSPGRAEVVPTGYDATFWTPGANPREDIAVTVGHAPTRERLAIKGIDLFLEAAKANRDIEFHVVGELPPGTTPGSLGANVVADGWLSREALRDLYRRAKVYGQFSLHEGLPNAVCEAMLCGCVPVGTRVNGIPTAIGDAGFLVDRSVPSVSDGLRNAIADPSVGLRARERIARTFPVERRRDRLGEILPALVERGVGP